MQNEEMIRQIAVDACTEALQAISSELAEEVARKVLAALPPEPMPCDTTKELRDGTLLIAGARTQTEALDTLLAASSALTPSCGLLILRGNQATGWNCNNLTTLDNFKRATMDCTRGTVATVISSCMASAAQVADLDPVFVARLGLDTSARVLLLPVLLKERVAALLLAISEQESDLPGLELLVQVAQLTLDLQAYRKAPAAAPVPAPAPPALEPPQPVYTAPPVALPPAPVPQPVYAAPPAVEPQPVRPTYLPAPEPVYAAPVRAAYTPEVSRPEPSRYETPRYEAPRYASPVVAPPPPAAPVLDETHERARRFAKLLVEEIKLYNQAKVAEGRARGDLYNRLHDDIEKSRAAYQKRYGESVRDVDYFTQELMRILADNNPAVMGHGFPG